MFAKFFQKLSEIGEFFLTLFSQTGPEPPQNPKASDKAKSPGPNPEEDSCGKGSSAPNRDTPTVKDRILQTTKAGKDQGSTTEHQDRSSDIETKDQPPNDSKHPEQEAESGEEKDSSTKDTVPQSLPDDGKDDETSRQPQEAETTSLQPPEEEEDASISIDDGNGSSRPDSHGSPHNPSLIEGDHTFEATAIDGQNCKGDNVSPDSPKEQKEAKGTETQPLGDAGGGHHPPAQTDSAPTEDTESSKSSPESCPRRESKEPGPPSEPPTSSLGKETKTPLDPHDHSVSTSAGEVDTGGHDLKNEGKESGGSRGEKKDYLPKPKHPRRHTGKRTIRKRNGYKKRAPLKPRPELICRKPIGSVLWEIVLAEDTMIASVNQNHQPLKLENGGYPLSTFTGRLAIEFNEDPMTQVLLFNKRPLIFKLKKNWTGEGRRIPRLTKGFFIVIAPKDWHRDGHEQFEPEGCSDSAFMAHYFFRDGSETTEQIGGFTECGIDSSAPGFELKGKRLFDDSEEGELFVEHPPQLKHANRVVLALVGEERTDGWVSEHFNPSERILADVLNGRQGRFFVRVYDREGTKVDSGEFRYLQDLQEIRVNGEPYSENTLLLPSVNGYSPIMVNFNGVDDVLLHSNHQSDELTKLDENDSLIAYRYPKADRIRCSLKSGANHVDSVIILPRVWWRLEEDDRETHNWGDRPWEMTRKEFREHSEMETVIHLRLPLQVSSVKVGFDEEVNLLYRPKKIGNYKETEIHLIEFIDYDQIEHRLHNVAFLNVQIGKEVIPLIRIMADPAILSFVADPPSIDPGERAKLWWKTRNVEDVSLVTYPEIGNVEKTGNREVLRFQQDMALCGEIGNVEKTGSRKVDPHRTTTYSLQLMVSGKKYATRTLTVAVKAKFGTLDERPAQEKCNEPTERIYKITVFLDMRGQGKSPQALIEDVKTILSTMNELQVLDTVDLGPEDFRHRFRLIMAAPTSGALTSVVNRVHEKLRLDSTVYRVLQYYGV